MLHKATALPLCSVTPLVQICCLERLVGNRCDPFPRSSMNFADCGHQSPLGSMTTGTKEGVTDIATYFVVLLTAAFSAAAQAVVINIIITIIFF